MELKEAIYKRRSVRKYEDTPVPQEVLQELLEGACMASSGINQQPWYFLAITNEVDRQRYLSFMQEGFSRFRPILEKRFSRNPEVVVETGTFMTTLGGAPVVILVFLLKNDYLKTNGGRPAIQGVAAAIENLLLLAHDQGLAGCWMTSPVDVGLGDALRQAFAPEKGELLAAISWATQKRAPPPRPGERAALTSSDQASSQITPHSTSLPHCGAGRLCVLRKPDRQMGAVCLIFLRVHAYTPIRKTPKECCCS